MIGPESVPPTSNHGTEWRRFHVSKCTLLPDLWSALAYRRTRTYDIILHSVPHHVPLTAGALESSGMAQRFGQHRSEADWMVGGHSVLSNPGLRRLQSEHVAVC